MLLFLLLQLAAIVAAVAVRDPGSHFNGSCDYPLPAYGNGTRADSWPEYIYGLKRTSINGAQGVTDTWDNNDGGPVPWPRNRDDKVVIPYCFMEKKDRANIRNVVENAMGKWIEYLGGEASATSGHAISFQERKDNGGNPVYCTKNGDRNKWNSDLSYDTVAVEWTRGASWGGSVALTQNGKPWQQQLAIADGYTLIGTMHELGHILGMAHEAARGDRDTYIWFDYHKLLDWDMCWRKARNAEGDRITEDGPCMSMYKAIKYGCSCSAYIKNMVEPGWSIKAGSGYDLNSIMHYPSRSGHATQQCADDGENCPLYAYVDSNNHGEGVYEVVQARKPSEADIMWVKRNYPWKKKTWGITARFEGSR